MANEEPRYLAWIRKQPCTVGGDCFGATQAHHITGAGMGLRAHDHETVPLCVGHHAQLHSGSGYFRMMKKDEKRAWQRQRVAEYRAEYLATKGEGEVF